MQKLLSLVLIGIICLTLAGCGNANKDSNNNDNNNNLNNNDYEDAEVYNNGNDTGEIIETNITLFEELRDSNKLSLIYVGRPTCPACVNFYPNLESFVNEYKVDIYYTNLDKWDSKDLDNVLFSTLSEVKNTPTIVVMYNGELIDMSVGNKGKDSLADFVKNYNIIE